MSVKFTHYLITRYNIRLDQWEKDVQGQSTLGDPWMQHRFELFSRYCFPSVVAQTTGDFTWLIYLESTTSPFHVQQIRNLTLDYPFIQIRLVEGYFGCLRDIDAALIKSHASFVITSRLDNDDAIDMGYIRTVQDYFVPEDKTLINMLNGCGYMPHRRVAMRLMGIQRNSFSSFIEERRLGGGHISVRGFPHGVPPVGTTIINVEHGFHWLKIFHERNLLSKAFGYPILGNSFLARFGIEPEFLALKWGSTFIYSFTWAVDGLKRKVKKWFKTVNQQG